MFNSLLTRAPDDMIMYPVGSVYLRVREMQMQLSSVANHNHHNGRA